VPHTPAGNPSWEGQRPFHLLNNLCTRHEIHYVTWQKSRNLLSMPTWGHWTKSRDPVGCRYLINLGANLPISFKRGRYPGAYNLLFSTVFFQKAVREIIMSVDPNVIIYSSSHHFTGFPPFDLPYPIIFDYVDLSPKWVEKKYIKNSIQTIAVSNRLCEAAQKYGGAVKIIPNGVALNRFQIGNRTEAKTKLGINQYLVVSLIGLTCSPRFYFLDAIKKIQKKINNIMFLVVGSGTKKTCLERKAKDLGIRNFLAPGHIPNDRVHEYFLATDIGLYPGEDIPYYRDSCPIKIMEYTAAGAQVVSSPVDLFTHGWNNIRICNPTADDFANGIVDAVSNPKTSPDMTPYHWPKLAREFEEILGQIVKPG